MFLVYHEFVYGNEGEAHKYDLDMLNKDAIDRFSVSFSLVVILVHLVVKNEDLVVKIASLVIIVK